MRIFCEHAQTQYLKLEEYTVIHINSKQMYYIITIELMFAGINMFLARLRLILARAQRGLK